MVYQKIQVKLLPLHCLYTKHWNSVEEAYNYRRPVTFFSQPFAHWLLFFRLVGCATIVRPDDRHWLYLYELLPLEFFLNTNFVNGNLITTLSVPIIFEFNEINNKNSYYYFFFLFFVLDWMRLRLEEIVQLSTRMSDYI